MNSYIKLFLRLALSFSFLSAVADRLGWWPATISVWGTWQNFISYTQLINPWAPVAFVPALGFIATAAEVAFALCLLVGFKTELTAKLSGVVLLAFAFAMTFSTGIKGAFDYSVFSAAAAAFALSTMREKRWEIDSLFSKK